MITIEKTIVIDRRQQEVFEVASNPANAHKWQSVIKSKKWASEGPHGVGSTLFAATTGNETSLSDAFDG